MLNATYRTTLENYLTTAIRYLVLFAIGYFLASCPRSVLAQDDAVALFRDEIIAAPARLRIKGSMLSDETRFAAAATGLSWRPSWVGRPLIKQTGKILSYEDGPFRLSAFNAAIDDRANKIAFAFALSLVLDPPDDNMTGWRTAYDLLKRYPADFEKALVGVLSASEKLPLLYEYRHAAVDMLVYRASPRLLPLFLGLAGSDDRYLRSRAISGLGVIGYRAGTGLSDTVSGLLVEPKEFGISAVQSAMIFETVKRAAEDGDFRMRAAAALALGLMADEESQKALNKLAKDRAYILSPGMDRASFSILFPVRRQAASSLLRWSVTTAESGGVFDAKGIGKARRGGKDVSNESKEGTKRVLHRVRFNDIDW